MNVLAWLRAALAPRHSWHPAHLARCGRCRRDHTRTLTLGGGPP